MRPISATELTRMRTVQNWALPSIAILQRITLTNDGMGGETEAWPAAGTVICRIMPQPSVSLVENVSGGQVISDTRWNLTLPVGTVITARDRVTVSGRTFQVIKVNNGESWRTAVRCEVEAFNEELRV